MYQNCRNLYRLTVNRGIVQADGIPYRTATSNPYRGIPFTRFCTVKSVCLRRGGGVSTQMYVRTEGEGVRAGYILNNVSNCFFFISELQK
jgi:hypothetical protein